MKIIAVMTQKGGVGKTVTASSIAYILGEEQKKRVLLVDADQQGNVSMLFGRFEPTGIGMSELLERHRAAGGTYSTADLIQTTDYRAIRRRHVGSTGSIRLLRCGLWAFDGYDCDKCTCSCGSGDRPGKDWWV